MSTTITTGQNILLFGDFNQFQIVDRVGVSVEFIPNVFDQGTGRPSGTRAWLMHWRFGSGVRDANAFRVLLL
jgi:HK97 family phage major capsid protein